MDSTDYNLDEDKIAIERVAKGVCRNLPEDYTAAILLQAMNTNANQILQNADEHDRIREELEIIFEGSQIRTRLEFEDETQTHDIEALKIRRHELFVDTAGRQIAAVIIAQRYADMIQEYWSHLQQEILNKIQVQPPPVITLE